jgi:putative ABC transport system permease protein
VLAAQADPGDPTEANVSQPSSALTAQADAAGAFDTLFLGLGAVALLVGTVGVANIMVISVLERRQEIGLRRALGATQGHIRIQFLSEATLLALAGGAIGVVLGVISTAVYAHIKGWSIVIPPCSLAPSVGTGFFCYLTFHCWAQSLTDASSATLSWTDLDAATYLPGGDDELR